MKLILCFGVLLASVGFAAEKKAPKKILIVVSSTDTLHLQKDKKVDTGFYLSELAIPAMRFIDAGYELVVATPNGEKPTLDDKSDDVQYFDNDKNKLKAAKTFVEEHPAMKNIKSLSSILGHTDDYVAIFVPGGHAPMNDLMQDDNLGRILRKFHDDKKVTAFLCHGPLAALAAVNAPHDFRAALIKGDQEAIKKAAKDWPYEGYRMTVFSNVEEREVEKNVFEGKVLFYPADALKKAGAKVETAGKFEANVVQDHEVITGQNPASTHRLTEMVLKAIEKSES